jgi:hypothetical protein
VFIYYGGIKWLCANTARVEIMMHHVDIPILGVWDRTQGERSEQLELIAKSRVNAAML